MQALLRYFWSGAVFRHELRLLILNPATPVFLAFGWAAVGLLAFYAVPLLHAGNGFAAAGAARAALAAGPLANGLSAVPWILTLLLPLLVMGMADDERTNRAERMLTLPISPDAIWYTRFILYWLVIFFFLAGTWPLLATVMWLGNVQGAPDALAVARGYAAAGLLGGVQLALVFWLVAESGQAVVAFVCGFIISFALVVAGWPFLGEALRGFPHGGVPEGVLGDALALANMLAMPVATGLGYLIYRRRRMARSQGLGSGA